MYDNYKYVLFKIGKQSRGNLMKSGKEFNDAYLAAADKNPPGGLFRSIALYPEEILEHWKIAEELERQIKVQKGEDATRVKGSVSSYTGLTHSDFAYIDIDCKKQGLNVSLEHARKLVRKITGHGVGLEAIRCYFSGAHGFHIYIPWGFMEFAPSKTLHANMHGFVDKLCEGHGEIDYDEKIYIRQLALRLPWSVNEKSGLFKIPISASDLLDSNTTPAGILEAAKGKVKSPKYNNEIVKSIQSLQDLWPQDAPEKKKYVAENEFNSGELEGVNIQAVNTQQKVCMQLMMQEDILDGKGRHDVALRLASYMSRRGDSPDMVRAAMGAWYKRQTEPVEEKKFWEDVEDGVKKKYIHPCQDQYLAARCDKRCFLYYKNVVGANRFEQEGTFKTIKDMQPIYDEIQNNGRRVSFGIDEIDKVLGGWAPGEVSLLLGRPGAGKTTFMMFLCQEMSKRTGMPILVFEQELHEFLIFKKSISAALEISNEVLSRIHSESREAKDSAFDEIVDTAMTVVGKVYYCTIDRLTTEDKIQLIEAFKRKHGMPGAVFEDYLGRGKAPGADKRHQVGSLASDLKTIAKECDVPYMALVQVARGQGEDHTTPLTMFDGKDSSEIEQVASYMFGIYRPDYNQTRDDDIVAIQILKAREGGENIEFKLRWKRAFGHYSYDALLNSKGY